MPVSLSIIEMHEFNDYMATVRFFCLGKKIYRRSRRKRGEDNAASDRAASREGGARRKAVSSAEAAADSRYFSCHRRGVTFRPCTYAGDVTL